MKYDRRSAARKVAERRRRAIRGNDCRITSPQVAIATEELADWCALTDTDARTCLCGICAGRRAATKGDG